MPDKFSIAAQSEVLAESGETSSPRAAATVAMVKVERNSVDSRVGNIAESIKKGLRAELDEKSQSEIAQLANLLPHLRAPHNEKYVSLAEIAVAAIITDKPNLILAREIREELNRRLRQPLLTTLIKGALRQPVS